MKKLWVMVVLVPSLVILASVVVGAQTGQTVFTSQTPVDLNISDAGTSYELGMKWLSTSAGYVTALRYWRAPSDAGPHTGRLWRGDGELLASVAFTGETTTGWQQQALPTPVPIQPNTTYVVSVNVSSHYVVTQQGLAASVVHGDLRSVADGANGVYGAPATFPTNAFANSNYFRDIVFVAGATLDKISGDNQSGLVGTQLSAPLVVEARDITGTPLAATEVTFTVTAGGGTVAVGSVLTDSAGRASTTWTLGSTAGVQTVQAAVINIGSVEFRATGNADVASKLALTPANATIHVSTLITYVATVQDQFGNTVMDATNPVSFGVSGVTGTFEPNAPVTPSDGQAAASLTPTTTGTATVTATASGLESATATLVVIDPAISKVSGDNQNGVVGEALGSPLVVEVMSGGSEPLAGMPVNFVVTDGGGSVSPGSVTTDSNGQASTTWTLGTALGTQTVIATVPNVGSVMFTATASPGAATQLTLSPASSSTHVNNAVSYTATVQDQFGNTVTTATTTVDFTATGVSGSFSPDASGTPTDGQVTVSFTPTTTGTATVMAAASGLAGATASLAVVSGSIMQVSGDNQIGAPGTVLGAPLVVEVRDDSNAPLAGTTVSFVVTGGGGTVSPGSAVTDAAGQASTTLTVGPVAGINTVSATAQNVGTVIFKATVPNQIYLENLKTGTTAWEIPSTDWVSESSPEIAGYADKISVLQGDTLAVKVSLAQPGSYTINVYRLGHYGGTGGRLVASSGALSGITQPECAVTEPSTLLIECDWSTSYVLNVTSDWTSGLYVANLQESASGKQSQLWFVVRDDNSTSDILFQSSFTTFLAYNNYGDSERHSLYGFNSTGGIRALKVSFDRPFGQVTTWPWAVDNILRWEFPMVRWLESQAYDVSYVTNMDVHVNPALLLQHKAFLSVGHDEYWSEEMRDAVEQARDAGVNLGFFSANTAYWRVRFEPSSLTGTPNRVMVCYKEPLANDLVAPTYLWRGPENNRPENELLGVMYIGDDSWDLYGGYDHIVTNSADPYYAFTGLQKGQTLSRLVGFEWDAVVNNGFTPDGLVILSESIVNPRNIAPGLPPGTDLLMSHTTRYTAASGAKVFAIGSIQWVWGLDSTGVSPREDPRAQQFVTNVLVDLGAIPLTPSPDLVLPGQ